jgi:hypothetical protein
MPAAISKVITMPLSFYAVPIVIVLIRVIREDTSRAMAAISVILVSKIVKTKSVISAKRCRKHFAALPKKRKKKNVPTEV